MAACRNTTRTRRGALSRWLHWSLPGLLALNGGACVHNGDLGRFTESPTSPRAASRQPFDPAVDSAASGELPSAGRASPATIQTVGYQPGEQAGGGEQPYRIHFSAAEERRSASNFDTSADDARTGLAQEYPDEYLFDGGDRGYPVHYEGRGIAGLESEDTVAEFTDSTGKSRVRVTNRVAIYSPKFGNITNITHASEDVSVGRLTASTSSVRNAGLRNDVALSQQSQPLKLQNLVERKRGSEIEVGQKLITSRQETRLAAHVHTLYPANTWHFVTTGALLNSEEARLAESLQAAVAWSRKQYPIISSKLESVGDIKSTFRDTEVVGLKENPLSAGRLRIVKLADKHVAEPGDIVTFTIRYDNQGHRELSDLVITDNLTPRLQYVPDSGTSDRAGRLVTEDNGEGSLVLRWELDQPLPGRQGGVVTFQARVK